MADRQTDRQTHRQITLYSLLILFLNEYDSGVNVLIAEIWRFFFFFKLWQPSAILHLLCACLDHGPQRVLRGIYHCAKCGWNRYSSCDNMKVLTFNQFGLKMPIHAPNEGFWGILSPKWAAVTSRSPKRHLLVQKHVI